MVRLLMLVALALAPAAAAAGTRATYVDDHGPRQTLVIADNGDLDVELRRGQHLVVRGGRAFIVEERLTGPIVTPLEELEAAARERAGARPRPRSPQAEAAAREAEAALEEVVRDIEPAQASPAACLAGAGAEGQYRGQRPGWPRLLFPGLRQ